MDEKLVEASRMEEAEIENPDNTLFYSDPVFVINEAPSATQISYALERDVPVVVILTLDKFKNIQDRFTWVTMNIPTLGFICVDWAGNHSNIPFIKNKWRETVFARHNEEKNKMRTKYSTITNPGIVGKDSFYNLLNDSSFISNIQNMLRSKNNTNDRYDFNGPDYSDDPDDPDDSDDNWSGVGH